MTPSFLFAEVPEELPKLNIRLMREGVDWLPVDAAVVVLLRGGVLDPLASAMTTTSSSCSAGSPRTLTSVAGVGECVGERMKAST